VAVRRLFAGEPTAAACVDLRARAEAADAATLGAWIAAVGALAAAAEGAADAAQQARAAATAARTCGVPGAQALAALALAATLPATATATVTAAVATARALAAEQGLPWPAGLEQRLLAGRGGPPEAGAAAVPGSGSGAAAEAGSAAGAGTGSAAEPVTAPAGLAVVAAPEVAPVVVRCFGAFEIAAGGRPLDWRSVRPRSACALRLLAARTPHPVHREVLLTLWPGLPPGQATHSLQVAMSTLRAFLAPDAPRGSARMVDRVGETYVLALPPGSRSDVLDLRTALEAADRAARTDDTAAERTALAAAVAAYRGELLPEDGPAEWVVPDREQWRLRVAAACTRLAALHAVAGDLRAAVEAARRGLEVDPFCDPLWRALISALSATGDTAAEARARQEYAAVLRELGVAPPPAPSPVAAPPLALPAAR
jgi:DNA-binding SARP family transcriptional activator